MKKIKKALALVLALAMIATVVPVASTEAASTAKLSATTATIAAGSKKVITLTTPSTWKKVKTSWKVGKKSVAQIVAVTKKASVRAQAAGETNVKVKVTYAKSNKKGAKRYSKSLYCKVTVKECILKSVKQTKFDTIEAVVAGKMPTVKPQDVVITNTSNNAVSAVKSVAVDEKDSTKLIITTYAAMNDGKDYTVAFSGMSKEFTATDGKVADVAVSPLTITANTTGSEVKAQLLDKNQVVVEEYGIGDALPGKVDYSITSGNGYTSGNKLVLPEVGNTATAKVTYHSFEYDSTGVETGVIEKTFTITAVADSATTSNWNYTITRDRSVNWKSSVQKVTEVATNEERNAFFYFVDSGKNDVTANGYSVESSDNSILLLANTPLEAASVAGSKPVTVTGVNPGTAYINVLKDGKVVTSLPVTVKAARKLSNIKLGKTTLYSSNDGDVTEKDETTIKGYDQYGEEYPIVTVTGTILNAPSNATRGHQKNDPITVTDDQKKIDPSASGFEKGDYLVKVEAKDRFNNAVSKTITLKAVDTASISASVYELSISSSEVDLAIASSTIAGKANKDLTIKVVEKKGNAPVAVKETATIKVTDPKNVVKENSAGSKTLSLVSEAGGVVTKNYTELGKYSVHAEYTDEGGYVHKFDRTFTLKDTQTKASADVKKTKDLSVSATGVADADAKSVLEAAGVAEYYYDGVKVTTVNIDATNAAKENGKALYIGTVKIDVTTTPGGLTVKVPVEINRTFTLN